MKIKDIAVRKIFDSRGNPTVEIELITKNGKHRASVPAGKSRGKNEAFVLAPALVIRRALPVVRRALRGKSFLSLSAFDWALRKLDGTKKKSRLGGNFMLGLSVAAARALAAERGEEAWRTLRREFFPGVGQKKNVPMIFSNLMNGGAHAADGLDIQEYMVVVEPGRNIVSAIGKLIGLYGDLEKALHHKLGVLPIGDEAGYAVPFRNDFAPIALLGKLIRKKKLSGQFRIALDAAATSFHVGHGYRFDKKTISAKALGHAYQSWLKREPLLCSIEDPFAEGDLAAFHAFHVAKRCLVVGDDLTTTNPKFIEKYGAGGLVTGVIIKPNQIGTVSEACAAIAAARRHKMFVIISHRSGETEDAFLVELARAANADAVKIGAPARERMVKFNELIRLYGA